MSLSLGGVRTLLDEISLNFPLFRFFLVILLHHSAIIVEKYCIISASRSWIDLIDLSLNLFEGLLSLLLFLLCYHKVPIISEKIQLRH